MASVSLHTGIVTSPKHAPLSDGALRLWLHGLCWSKEHLTDGYIPTAMVPTLHPRAARVVGELLVSLWKPVDGGYVIDDYQAYAETRAQVERRQAKWADDKRRHNYRETADIVRARDGDVCGYCGHAVRFGARGPRGGTFDHVDPTGETTVDNLAVACRSCNSRKGRRTPTEAGMSLMEVR